jgi:AcrR family transcriptional regulator
VNAAAGLRERKKEATRRAIFESAQRLFAERGFDEVTVSEIAAAADVSEVTVFNHFRTKEDLFFGGLTAFEERILTAIAERRSGQSVLSAFMRTVAGGAEDLAKRERAASALQGARAISESRSLRARERELVDGYAERLAAMLAEETRSKAGDLEPVVAAAALMAVHRALVLHVRGRLLDGWRGPRLVADVRAQTRRAFARLERGLGGYAVRA